AVRLMQLPVFEKLARAEAISSPDPEQVFLDSPSSKSFCRSAFSLAKAALENGSIGEAIDYFNDTQPRRQPYLGQFDDGVSRKVTGAQFYLDQLASSELIDNLVLVESFLGRRIGCNPLALVEYALRED